MKKLFSVILVLILTGCGAGKTNLTPVTKGITFDCDVTYYNESYECKCSIAKNGDTKVEFISPADIEGLEFSFTKKGVKANFKETDYNAQKIVFENSVASFIYDVFQNSDTDIYEQDDVVYTKGVTEDFEYKLHLGGTGLPIKITTRTEAVEVIFKNVTLKSEE